MISLIAGFAMIAFVISMLITNATNVENDVAQRVLADNLLVQHRAAHEWVVRNAATSGNVPERLRGQITNMADWRSRVVSVAGATYVVTWSGERSEWGQDELRRAAALIHPADLASMPRSGVGVFENARIGPVTLPGVALPMSSGDVAAVSVIVEGGGP